MRKRSASKKKSPGQMSKQVRLGLAVLLFLTTLIVVGKAIDFVGSLNRPFAPDGTPLNAAESRWENKETLNLVVKSEDVYLLSLNPQESSVVIFKIPADAYINVPFGFGSWSVRSIYGLGQNENPPVGAKLLAAGISSAMGVFVNGYIITSGNQKMEHLLTQIKQNPLNLIGLLRSSKTDLSLNEYWNFWWAVKKVRSDKIESIELEKTGVVLTKKLADGSLGYTLDQYKLDVLLQKQLEDLNLREEGRSVGIFNATNYPGLAERASRMITNMGGRVIFATNLENKQENSMVLGEKSYTFSRLSKIFSSPACLKKHKCSIENKNLSPSTAEVNIILGEDFYLRYNKK